MRIVSCIARRKTYASSSAEATRTRTLPVGPVGSRTAPRRWKTRYATSRCRISTRARAAGRRSRRARPRKYPRSRLPIIKLRTRAIARNMKLVQIIRTTALSVTPFAIAVLAISGDLWDLVAAMRAACYPRAGERRSRRGPAS